MGTYLPLDLQEFYTEHNGFELTFAASQRGRGSAGGEAPRRNTAATAAENNGYGGSTPAPLLGRIFVPPIEELATIPLSEHHVVDPLLVRRHCFPSSFFFIYVFLSIQSSLTSPFKMAFTILSTTTYCLVWFRKI